MVKLRKICGEDFLRLRCQEHDERFEQRRVQDGQDEAVSGSPEGEEGAPLEYSVAEGFENYRVHLGLI